MTRDKDSQEIEKVAKIKAHIYWFTSPIDTHQIIVQSRDSSSSTDSRRIRNDK
ncbi:MAG: hypothetical protein QXR38_01450 [Nitrososphaerales archaeon]